MQPGLGPFYYWPDSIQVLRETVFVHHVAFSRKAVHLVYDDWIRVYIVEPTRAEV